jgi:hypothetical protein
MENFLVDSYDLDNILFTKPKKYTEYFVSKVKYKETEDLVVQFPKMVINEDPSEKNIEFEFTSSKGYNKVVYNFLRSVDKFTINKINQNSQEWFGRSIPTESVKKMYNSFIKAPQTTENKSTVNFAIKKNKNEVNGVNGVQSVFIDRKGNEIDYSQFKKGEIVECIAQFKYIFFSRDTCFAVWELVSAKLYKRIEKVPKFGFIDDPDDRPKVESDDEEIENLSFF